MQVAESPSKYLQWPMWRICLFGLVCFAVGFCAGGVLIGTHIQRTLAEPAEDIRKAWEAEQLLKESRSNQNAGDRGVQELLHQLQSPPKGSGEPARSNVEGEQSNENRKKIEKSVEPLGNLISPTKVKMPNYFDGPGGQSMR